ncbi:MAG: cysteine-rich CWC family protein [Tissierellales bacterium]
MELKESDRICPLCGQDNNCQHGLGKCWCETVIFPKHILNMIPEDKKGKACICKLCLEKYQR